MKTQDWTERALTGEVWSIGQLDRETIRALDELARQGRLVKSRENWAGLAHLKTVWRPS